MSPIKTLGLTKLTPEQFAQFIRNVLDLLVPISSDLTIKGLISQINALLVELDAAIGRTNECEYTAQLEQIDYLRDELIKVLDKYLDFAITASMLDKTRADQAKVVLEMRNRYDSRIAYLSYQEETAAITSMVAGFETINGAVEESKSDVIISALTTANKKFETVYIQKTQALATDPKVRQSRPIRYYIAALYYRLTGYINAVAPANPVLYKAIVDSIAVVIDDFKAKAEANKTRGETAKDKASKAILGTAI